MIEWLRALIRAYLGWIRSNLVKRRMLTSPSEIRRVKLEEDAPSDRFVLSVALMIVFFVGLVALEIVYIIVIGEWNEAIFNGIMLLVGSLIGALFGYREAK